MHVSYYDITSRIEENPSWYDGNGVPRYGEFDHCQLDVYAEFVVYAEIACQSCAKRFRVAVDYPRYHFDSLGRIQIPDIEEIAPYFHYGDPPAHGCVGDTMNCVDVKTVQVWGHHERDWVRLTHLEGLDLRPDWAKEKYI